MDRVEAQAVAADRSQEAKARIRSISHLRGLLTSKLKGLTEAGIEQGNPADCRHLESVEQRIIGFLECLLSGCVEDGL